MGERDAVDGWFEQELLPTLGPGGGPTAAFEAQRGPLPADLAALLTALGDPARASLALGAWQLDAGELAAPADDFAALIDPAGSQIVKPGPHDRAVIASDRVVALGAVLADTVRIGHTTGGAVLLARTVGERAVVARWQAARDIVDAGPVADGIAALARAAVDGTLVAPAPTATLNPIAELWTRSRWIRTLLLGQGTLLAVGSFRAAERRVPARDAARLASSAGEAMYWLWRTYFFGRDADLADAVTSSAGHRAGLVRSAAELIERAGRAGADGTAAALAKARTDFHATFAMATS